MEMYADEDGRGGVLEPEGIVGIKYRRDRQLETMARLDQTYADLKAQLNDKSLSRDQQSDIKVKMTEREQLLLPVYSQISLQFADLHDRAGRMKAKNVIRQPLQWKNARRFFYWRLRRRLNEESLIKKMASASVQGPMSRTQALTRLTAWSNIPKFETDDRAMATWYEENRKTIQQKIDSVKADGAAFDISSLLSVNKEAGLKALKQHFETMPVQEREDALKYLQG